MQRIQERRQENFERFQKMRRFEEMTDIAERIGYPINITVPYRLKDGALYALTDTVERPFQNKTLQAMLAGKTNFIGDQAFEQTRLAHEHDEALLADRLARGELEGTILVKISKVPDAVVEGRTSIKGYRRDLLRSFVRIYHRTPDGVDCRLFTLDHNNREGMQRVGELLGIDTMKGSEEILADHALFDVSDDIEAFTEALANETIRVYDNAIPTESYAGSIYTSKQDAMGAILSQGRLVDQHMRAISDIMAQSLGVDRLETERERTAAAIKLASEGVVVGSNADSSVTSEVSTGNYGGECATATTTGMSQASQTMENVWSHGECQVCFAKTMVGSCMVCAGCAAADDRGVDLLKLRERNLKRRATRQKIAQAAIKAPRESVTYSQPVEDKADSIKQRYGKHAVLKREIIIGGAKQTVRDRRTDKVLA